MRINTYDTHTEEGEWSPRLLGEYGAHRRRIWMKNLTEYAPILNAINMFLLIALVAYSRPGPVTVKFEDVKLPLTAQTLLTPTPPSPSAPPTPTPPSAPLTPLPSSSAPLTPTPSLSPSASLDSTPQPNSSAQAPLTPTPPSSSPTLSPPASPTPSGHAPVAPTPSPNPPDQAILPPTLSAPLTPTPSPTPSSRISLDLDNDNEPQGPPELIALFPLETRPYHKLRVQASLTSAEVRKLNFRMQNPGLQAKYLRSAAKVTYSLAANISATVAMTDRSLWWWRRYFPSWEPDTFHTFATFINNQTTVIDFGTWIGPTVIFAARLGCKRIIALEPDIYAHEIAEANYKLNPNIDRIVTFMNIGISDKFETVTLRGVGGSDSATTRSHRVKGLTQIHKTTRQIDTVPLFSLLVYMGVEFNSHTNLFIKVDIEGAEAYTIPSWVPIMKRMNELGINKPTFYISTHDDPDYHTLLFPFINEYKYIYINNTRWEKDEITKDHLGPLQAFVVTDRDVGPTLPGKWVD